MLTQAETFAKRKPSDVWNQIRQQALLAQLKSAHHQAQSELNKARLHMLVSLNKELNAPITITGDFSPLKTDWDLPHLNLWAMEFRPELKSAIYALEADNIAIDLALSKRYPDIILNASYERLGADDLDDVNKQVSLAVRLPLPYNFSEQIAQKKAEQQKSTLRRAAIEDKIHVEVAENFENMRFWQEEVLDRQEAYHTLAQLIKQAPSPRPVESLEALKAFLETAQGYLNALKQNHTAKAELEWAIGQDLQ